MNVVVGDCNGQHLAFAGLRIRHGAGEDCYATHLPADSRSRSQCSALFFFLVAQLQHVVMPLGYLQSTHYQGSFSLSAADSVIPGG